MKDLAENKKYVLAICIAILLASCSSALPAVAVPPMTSIRVVMDDNYPPYIFLDEQGNARGILVDQWALWEKHTGVKVELSALPWEDALSGMKNGEFDVIDTIFYTEERARVYDFTDAYARIDVPIFFHNNISGLADVNDLKGFRVAVKFGDADAEYLIDSGLTDLVYYDSYEEIVQAAARKEVTIFVIDQPPGLYFLYKYGLQDQFNYSTPLFSGEFHRAVKKGDAALLDLVTSGFASIGKSEYQAIDNRWSGIQQNNKWQDYLPYVQAGAIIAFLFICILLVFNRTLRRRVAQRTRELNQALASLQKNERKYREIFNATNEAIFIHALPGGELLHVNKTMLQMYGFETEEEALSKSAADLSANTPPYTQFEAQEKIRKALEEGPQVFEWLAKKKSGEPFWVEVSLRSSEIGGEGQVLGVVRDIAKRKQAEEALRKSEARFRRLADHAPDIIFRYDIRSEMKLTYISPAVQSITGYTPEECYADSLLMLNMIHPDDLNLMMGYMQSLTLPDEPLLARWVGKDGITRWMESRIVPIRDADGQLVAIEGITRDITERKQAETALRINEAQLKANLENTPNVAVQWYNLKGEVIYWNKASEQLYGYTSEEAMGKTLDKLIHTPEEAEEFMRIISEISSTGKSYGPYEAKIRKYNGEEGWVLATTFTIPMGSDGLGVVCMDVDITERKRAEEALRESESLLREAQVAANMGSYVLDFASDMWKSSAVLDEIFGIDDTYVRSVEGWSSLIHPDHQQQMTDYFANEVLGRRVPFDREYKIIRPNDKAERWVHGLGKLESDAQGNLVKMYGVIQDITERKQVEQSLRERERQYRTLVEQIPAIVYVDDVSNDAHTIYISPQIEKILGYTPQYWIENSPAIWDDRIHPDDLESVSLKYLLCAKSGEPSEAEYRMIAADGHVVWLYDQAIMLRDEIGNPQLIHGVMQDITVHKQAEEEMRQRVMELETLYESGLVINQLLDPKEIGQRIIELLDQNLGWHQTAIRLYHPQDESLELLAFNRPGVKSEAERHEVEKRLKTAVTSTSHGMSGWAVYNKQIIHSNDLQNDPHYLETYPGLQSGLYVPIKLGDRVIGVISIESEQFNAFSSADERLAATLANQAASALENARLFEAERKQRQISDALRDALSAGASMSASLDFETIMDRLLEALERVVPFEGGCIMLVQPEKQKISVAKMRGYNKLNKQLMDSISKFSFDIAFVENLRWILNNKQPLIIPDIEQYSGWIRIPESSFTRSWAGVPIIVNDNVIALFSLDSDKPNFFTNEHIELMLAFTGQASLALQNARLFEQTERRAREFGALYETSRVLSLENDLNVMLRIIVEHTQKLLDSGSSGMYLYHLETDELELTVDTTPYAIVGTRLRSDEGAAGYVAQTRQPLRIDDYSTWEGQSQRYEGISIRAVLEVPMLYGGELIGVLAADELDGSERKFTEADEHLLSLFASQAAGAIHSARLRGQTAHRLEQLQALHIIDRAISSSFDLRPILNTVIDQTILQLSVDAVDVLLFHPHLQSLEYVAGQGFRTRAIEKTNLRLGECLAGLAALERRTIHIPDFSKADLGFARPFTLEGEEFLGYYAVPLTAKGEVKGVLEVFNRTALPKNAEWLDFLETLAGQAAITIDQTQLFDDLQRANLELVIAYDATIEGWARAMDLRDKETENHTRRVTELSLSLAKALGVKDSEMLHIRRGALLHDIGKIGVPDNILLKDGKLTEEEWVFMRRHPQFAYEMLKPIKYLRQALDIPYCHHEKWDGTGYPRGLKGGQIPLAARIFAIADVWDAIISDRPYRKAWTEQEALAYIREQSGKQFDPKVVDAFLKMIGR